MENEGYKKRKGQKNKHADELICNVVYWKQLLGMWGNVIMLLNTRI